MRFVIERIEKPEWEKFSANAHLIAFNERSSAFEERIDYALLIVDKGVPAGYMTIKEMNADCAYLQNGGAFPEHEGTIHVVPQYLAAVKHLSKIYDTLWTRIENTNYPMLKLALRAGFEIVGTYLHSPKLFVELKLDSV